MSYTNFMLFGLALLGVLLHNLIEMNKLNRASAGNINIWKYLKIEQFSIYISVIVAFVAVLVKTEIKQLEQVGNWLGIAFVAIGYMGQSLLISVMGKATKVINNDNETDKKTDANT